MSDQVETAPAGDAGAEMIALKTTAEEWQAVLATAPAVDRLPAMVVRQYPPENFSESELGEIGQSVRNGVVLMHKLFGDKINSLFEHFDVHFGSGCEMLMEDIESELEDEEVVENYTPANICGRVIAYMAMDICTHQEFADLDDGGPVDEATGFSKSMPIIVAQSVVERIVACMELEASSAASVIREALVVVHGYIFILLEPDKSTVWH